MNARERILAVLCHGRERAHHRLVALHHEQALRGVAPPAVGVFQMCDELCWILCQHLWSRTRIEVLVRQAPDAAMADVVLEAVLPDFWTQEAAFAHPVALLNDAAVNVDNIEATVRTRGRVERPEIWVAAADELRLGVWVREFRDTILHLHSSAADEASDGLGQEDIATQFRGQAIPAE